jgi:hypothetical protein
MNHAPQGTPSSEAGRMKVAPNESAEVWGPYPVYDDVARLEYGRKFWRDPVMREALLRHWLDERHPYKDRFRNFRALVEEVLASSMSDAELNKSLLERDTSLRCIAREIPPVFGQFWKDPYAARALPRTACANAPDSGY